MVNNIINLKNTSNEKNLAKVSNLFQFFIKINLIFFILFSVIIFPAFADTKSDILKVIDNNYLATQNADVDAYVDTMDTIFLDISSPDYFSYKDYYRGTFDVIETINYSINEPQYQLMKNSALVFYNVKGTLKNKDTGEIKNIDNDVVTFLWNYNGDWKIRWTLTQSLYQLKAEAGLLSEVVVDMTLNDLDEVTLKEKAIQEGVYTELENELLINNENRDDINLDYENSETPVYNNYDDTYNLDEYDSESSFNWFWFWFIILLLIIFYFYKKRNKNKIKKNKNNNVNKKNSNTNNQSKKFKETKIKNDKKTKNSKVSITQNFLGKMYEFQELQKKKEEIITQKTGKSKSERDVDKYHRDLMFEDKDNPDVDNDGDDD